MTTTHDIDLLRAVIDDGDTSALPALADALEEIGEDEEATLVRADGVFLVSEPNQHSTVVMQPRGWHEPSGEGFSQMQRALLHIVHTAFGDYASGQRWHKLDFVARHHWRELLAEIHEAQVRLATSEPDVRQRVEAALAGENTDDLECFPALLNRLIDEASQT